jgi:hypothetical protein
MYTQIIYKLNSVNYLLKANLEEVSKISTNSNQIANNLQEINNTLLTLNRDLINYQNSFINQPWFSFIIGSLVTFTATFIYEYMRKRNERLNKIYKYLAEQYVFHDPDSLLKEAGITSTGYTQTVGGITTVIPEKTFSKKMRVYLWEHTNWANFPKGYLWYLYKTYDKKLSLIVDKKTYNEIKDSPEYRDTNKFFNKLKRHIFRISGESRGWHGEE